MPNLFTFEKPASIRYQVSHFDDSVIDHIFYETRHFFNKNMLIVPYYLIHNIVIGNYVSCVQIRPCLKAFFVEIWKTDRKSTGVRITVQNEFSANFA